MDSSRSVQQDDLRTRLGNWRNGDGPLWARLADSITEAISSGHISDGTRLPPERLLAAQLGIGRSTVVRALGKLSEQGLVRRVHGSGTTVDLRRPPSRSAVRRRGPQPLAEYHSTTTPVPIGLGATVIPDLSGLAPELFEISASDLAEGTGSGYVIPGLPGTRVAIAAMLTESGLPAEPDSVIVTTGATQSTALLIDHLIRQGDTVIVDRRAYPTALALLRRGGARIISAPEAQGGYTDPDAVHRLALQHGAAMVLLMTTCNAATGSSIPEHRHGPLLDLARSGVTIVDDRTLADYHPEPAPVPPGAHLYHPNVVTIGSLNKTYWGGLRIGWIHAHPTLVHPLVRTKASTDSGSSIPSQVLAVRLIQQRAAILQQRRSTAARARDAVTRVLEEQLPDWRIEGHPVGPAMWIRLPVPRDSAEFASYAYGHGVVIGYGGNYRADGRASQHIRLSLTTGPEAAAESVRRLAALWHELDHRR